MLIDFYLCCNVQFNKDFLAMKKVYQGSWNYQSSSGDFGLSNLIRINSNVVFLPMS